MPRSVVGGAPSNQHAVEGEVGYIAPDEQDHEFVHVQEPEQENVQDDVPAPATEDVELPAEPAEEKPDYNAYSVKDLIELCKARGIPFSGPSGSLPKAELVSRLQAAEGEQ